MIKLRRSTGYSFVKCRQALVKFGEENIKEAEKWLKIQAKKEGWAKAERWLVPRVSTHTAKSNFVAELVSVPRHRAFMELPRRTASLSLLS